MKPNKEVIPTAPKRKPPAAGMGRVKGSLNKTTRMAKDAIAAAAEGLGGVERLITWAQEDPLNERAFWSTIYPKLLPLQVQGPGPDGEHIITAITRTVVDPGGPGGGPR